MAFYDVVVLYEDAFEEAKAAKDRGTLVVTRKLLAKSDTPNPNFLDIATSTATWPSLGSRLPALDEIVTFSGHANLKFRCSSRNFSWYQGSENGVVIDLKFEGLSPYENTEGGGSKQPNSSNSQSWRRVSISTSQITIPATDYDGLPFCNSAGDPVDGLEAESSIAVLKYTNDFVADPNLTGMWHYLNKCNSDNYLGAEKYTLRVTGFNAEFDDGQMLWKCALEITYNPSTWAVEYYDAGLNEIVLEDGLYVRKAILDKFGNPVTQPVPLDGEGRQAEPIKPDEKRLLEESKLRHFFAMQEQSKLSAQPYGIVPFSPMLTALRIA